MQSIYPKTLRSKQLAALLFTRVFTKLCFFYIWFVLLLVVHCQFEILEFLVIFIDVIDMQRNAHCHRKIAKLASQVMRTNRLAF